MFYDNHIAIAYYSNFTITFSTSISTVIFNYKSIIVKRVNKKDHSLYYGLWLFVLILIRAYQYQPSMQLQLISLLSV